MWGRGRAEVRQQYWGEKEGILSELLILDRAIINLNVQFMQRFEWNKVSEIGCDSEEMFCSNKMPVSISQ